MNDLVIYVLRNRGHVRLLPSRLLSSAGLRCQISLSTAWDIGPFYSGNEAEYALCC